MHKGFLWFAQNNETTDYVELSIKLAKSIKYWNKENKITEFKVIVRPLQAVNKLHQQMQNMLERMKA